MTETTITEQPADLVGKFIYPIFSSSLGSGYERKQATQPAKVLAVFDNHYAYFPTTPEGGREWRQGRCLKVQGLIDLDGKILFDPIVTQWEVISEALTDEQKIHLRMIDSAHDTNTRYLKLMDAIDEDFQTLSHEAHEIAERNGFCNVYDEWVNNVNNKLMTGLLETREEDVEVTVTRKRIVYETCNVTITKKRGDDLSEMEDEILDAARDQSHYDWETTDDEIYEASYEWEEA